MVSKNGWWKMNNNSKAQRYKTVHDENLYIVKSLGLFALLICFFYTGRGVFIGKTIVNGIIKSWVSGYGIVMLLLVLIISLIFFLDWLFYFCTSKIVIRRGTMYHGIIVSEVEKKHAYKGTVRRNWKYTIELEDGSTYLSTSYTKQIPVRKKCTVYVSGSRCIITSFESS